MQQYHLFQVSQVVDHKHPVPLIIQWFQSVHMKPINQLLTVHQVIFRTSHIAPILPITSPSTAEIALAVGILLLCLYLLFSALPMSVIAWERWL